MRKLYPLTHSLTRSFARSIDIFHFQCSPSENENLNHKKYHFKFFNIYLQLEHVAEWARYVFACGTCTCEHSTYYCPLVVFYRVFHRSLSVCSFSLCTVEWIVSCCDCLCVPHSFVIRQIFGDFPKMKDSTLSRAFEKLSFSNKFLGLAVKCTTTAYYVGVGVAVFIFVLVLHVCKCNMSHVSVKSRSVYISPSSFS